MIYDDDLYAVNLFEKNLILPSNIYLMLYEHFENIYNKIVRNAEQFYYIHYTHLLKIF